MEIPNGYKLQLPANVDLNYDFAEYHASYSQDHRVLTSKRRLLSKLREIPVAELEDYRTFLKNLQNDVNQYVQTSSLTIPSPPNLPVPSAIRSFLGDIASLPESHNAEANQLDQDARAAMETQDVARAEYSLKTALAEKDPKFTRGWLHLGLLYAGLAEKDNAIAAFNHAIDSDPSLPICHRILAYALMSFQRPAEAIHAWQDLLKLVPDDQDAVLKVGGLLLMQQRYTEAISYLEKATKNDDSPTNRYLLARAYLHSGDIDKGAAMMDKSIDADSTPIVLNDAAYELADDNVSLPKALEYADRAVRRQEQILQEIKLDNLSPEAPEETVKIGYYWDTIGWVHFRLGHFALAESYLNAAWSLSQQSIVADHLGQVYEAEKKTPSAIQMYRLAISAFTPETEMTGADVTEIRKRLARLTPGSRAPTPMELLRSDPNGTNFNKMRLAKLPKFAAHGSAEFFLLFAPGPTLEDVRFISGSKNFKPAEKLFKSGKFPVAFPMGSSARLLRRGLAMCSEVTGCQMVLLAPDSVHSVK